MDAVEAAAPSGWSLQLIVDSMELHTAALVRNWRSGRPPRFMVFGTASAAVWDDLMDRLAGVMEEPLVVVWRASERRPSAECPVRSSRPADFDLAGHLAAGPDRASLRLRGTPGQVDDTLVRFPLWKAADRQQALQMQRPAPMQKLL